MLKPKVNEMNQNLEQTLNQFTEDVKRTYGETLLSVVLYGSAASNEYVEGRSNINCLVLLKEVTPDELMKCAARLPEWHKQGISTPLFIDPAYVRSSVDVFPIEFLDMKQRYRLLYGEDFLQKLELKRERLHFQCEQELKGKMLKLRQLYLEASQTGNRLALLLTKSISSFIVLFRALLHLQRMPASGSAEKLFAGLSQLRLSTEAIARVFDLRRQDEALSQTEIDTLFRRYLIEIEAIVEFVDKMNFEHS
jgi:predicted nucleotidyltransferase